MEIKNKKKDAILPLIISLVLVIGIFAGTKIRVGNINPLGKGTLFYTPESKMDQVLHLIQSSYVDSVSSYLLEETAIRSMLRTLDPHSQYIPVSSLAAVNEPMEGNFSGIGIQFNMINDTIVIINTVPKGPSEKVGIMSGDRLVSVDDSIVAGVNMPSNDIVKMLKGKTGTKVKVGIFRKGEDNLLFFNVTRDKIPLLSIDASYIISPEIAYVKINKFSKTTLTDFRGAMSKLKTEGMQKLIIDLRDNPGGLIDGAIGISELFLPPGALIVYTEGNERPRYDYFSKNTDISYTDMELVLLINEESASASEIVAGAIQDNDRGIIIGRRSFGKGLVQEQHSLYDGSAVRITVSRYYTPTGRSIQKSYEKGNNDYFNELSVRFQNGEMEQADSIRFIDSLKYITPAGKTVYGGGGIMPDIFIPVDTAGYSLYYGQVIRKGLVYRFAFNYTDKNRKTLESYNDYRVMDNELRERGILRQFVEFTSKQGVRVDQKDLKVSGELIENILIAYIVRNIFDDNAFYAVLYKNDKMILKAIEVLSNEDNY